MVLASYGATGDKLTNYNLVGPIRIMYLTQRSIMMTAPRDMVVAVVDAKSPDGVYVRLTTSVAHPRAPPVTSARVRMNIKLNGFVLKPGSPCDATNVAVLDPNGGLPNRLQELLAKARTKQLDHLDTFF